MLIHKTKKGKPLPTKLLAVLGLLLVAVLLISACGAASEQATATPVVPTATPVAVVPTTEVTEEAVVMPTTEVTEEEAAAAATPGEAMAATATDQAALRVSEVRGYQVQNFQGEDLGEVEDIVIGLNTHPDYAVLSFGGFLDIGDRLFAIPLNAMQVNTEDDTFFFDISEERLENAPGFTDDAWPNISDPAWDDDILEFWGTTQEATLPTEAGSAAGMPANGPAAIRASEIMGDNIRNQAGEEVGEVEDLIVNLEPEADVDRGADYAILSFGGFADIGDRLFIVPLRHLDLSAPQEDTITFNVDEATLQNAPSFTDDVWPDLTDPTWDDDAFTFWDTNAVTAASGAAPADTTDETTATTPDAAVVTIAVVADPEPAIRASELVDYQVVNPQGEDLGEIEDFIIGLNSGRVRYAVLSFGGFLDIGDELFPVPLNAMTFNQAENAFVLDVQPETLENASGFGSDVWPELGDPAWDANYGTFWENELGLAEGSFIGAGARDESFANEPGMRATELFNYPVRNSQGEDLGEIEDVLIGLDSGRAGFAVLSFGGFLDIGDKLFAIPMNALSFDRQNEVALLNVDQETLENAPSFDQNTWPDLNDPAWGTTSRDFWGNNAAAPGAAAGTDTSEAAPGGAGTTETGAAGTTPTITDTTVMTSANVAEPAMRISDLLGYDIRNEQGDELGQIEDLILGADSQRIRYAIASFGGLGNIGSDLFALPLNALTLDVQNETLVANVDETRLQNVPSFRTDAWPDLADPGWDNEFLGFWNSPDLQDEAGLRATEFMDYTLINSQGENLGEVEDLMVGLQSGRLTYAILSFGGFLDLGENVVAIPLNVLNFNNIDRIDQTLTFDIDEEMIQNAPSFNPNAWPDASDPRWDDDITNYWEANAVATGPKALRASDLIGYNVINAQGEDLGDVEDLMIGLNSGRVKYAVLSFGGFLGLGDKLFAVPLSSMQFSFDEEALIFDVPQEMLENAPGFDNNAWPDMANPQWDLDIGNYWQSPDMASEAGIRASELLDYNIQNFQQEDLGEIEDLLVSLNNGQISYAILSFGGFLELGDTLFAVPWQAMDFSNVDRDNGVLTFEVDEQMLQGAPGFTAETWPDTATPGWDDDFFNFWNRPRAE